LTEGAIGVGGHDGAGVGSMHNYGTDVYTRCPQLLSDIGAQLEPIFDLLYLSGEEAAAAPPSDARPSGLVLHSGHAIRYGKGGGRRETALKLHVDDSLVTATLCLRSVDLDGTELVFHGMQRLPWPVIGGVQAKFAALQAAHGVWVDRDEHQLQIKPTRGHALLHRGRHPHRTLPIAGGERISWVLWWHKKEKEGGEKAKPAGHEPPKAVE
jgi:hypothetical protein